MAIPRILFLFVIALVLCSSLVRAEPEPDLPVFSRSWIHARKVKRSDDIVELSHTIDTGVGPGAGLSRMAGARPLINGGITLLGPASRLSNFHQTASAWKLVGCTNSTRKQKVMAYCTSVEAEVHCSDIFNGGAKDTIIKLPDGCGASPFAHVVKFHPTRKSLPQSELRLIGKKNSIVFELVFDYDFKSIPYKEGQTPMQMHMEFSNLPGFVEHPNYGKPRSYHQWLTGINKPTPPKKNAGAGVRRYASENDNTIPISHDFAATLASLEQPCNGFDMTLSVETGGKITGTVSFGYYVSGTIIPPKIKDHYAYFNGNADVEVELTLSGLVQYNFIGLEVPVVPTIGLPGLNYPGLLTLGPYFEINSALTGDIALYGTITASTGFSMPMVDISIGNGSEPKSTSEGTNFANVKLSDSLQMSAGLTIALVPQLGVKISVLGGSVDADVSLQPSAGVTAGGTVNFDLQTGKPEDPCVELDGQVSLNWGVGGKIGPWGSALTGKIWGIQKKLWSQCFGGGSTTSGRITTKPRRSGKRDLATRSMTCPSVNPFSANSTSP
ncbi:hypothetical protein BC938DRAFT_474576 [Jimgerdemannia flammicorona]|uniref:Uncharacterized protein n=1 Tax=Jimgerdemannia flammicorona TaxID=994334 RepID=A0A433Q202_9FUNG|nr:hypothetical protein BC938DRAFT_474576 [Jimgerdemannia flammicorona]